MDALTLLREAGGDAQMVNKHLAIRGLYLVENGNEPYIVPIGTPPDNDLAFAAWDAAVSRHGDSVMDYLTKKGLGVRQYKGRDYLVRERAPLPQGGGRVLH
jgi:hypothetical protein